MTITCNEDEDYNNGDDDDDGDKCLFISGGKQVASLVRVIIVTDLHVAFYNCYDNINFCSWKIHEIGDMAHDCQLGQKVTSFDH